MGFVSRKMLYEDELNRIIGGYQVEYFIWGEELVEFTIVVLPKKGKSSSVKHTKSREGACLVMIDETKDPPVSCVSVQMSPSNMRIYISMEKFNVVWRYLYPDICAGIAMAQAAGEKSPVAHPEDILDLTKVQKEGFTLKLEHQKLIYERDEALQKAQEAVSRRQSLLDNPEMNYFYSSSAKCFHDRNCAYVSKISPEEFCASAEMPENMYMCSKCRRDMLVRRACAPRTKQIGPVKYFLRTCDIDDALLKNYVLKDGMKMWMASEDELAVHCHEDTWKICRSETGKLTLWHNNYVRVGEKERYVSQVTEGFHKQACSAHEIVGILDYIEGYTWDKHLKGEAEKKAGKNDKKKSTAKQALTENVAAETAVTEEKLAAGDEVIVKNEVNLQVEEKRGAFFKKVYNWYVTICNRRKKKE